MHTCRTKSHKKVVHELFESVAKFKYFGTILTIKTVFMKKLKADCFLEIPPAIPHRIFRLNFAFQKSKIKIHREIFLSIVLYGCEAWSLTLADDVQE